MYGVHVRIHLVLVGFSEITSRLIVQGSFIYRYIFFFSAEDLFYKGYFCYITSLHNDCSTY